MRQSEVAHAKLFAVTSKGSLRANLVGNGEPNYDAYLSEDQEETETAVVTLNVRAQCLPEKIVQQVETIQKQLQKFYQVDSLDYKHNALIPSPPKPTYRMI